MHQALRGNAHAHPLRLATSCVGHGHHCTRYTMLATVIVSMLCIVTPADSVKLTFTKNEGSGKKVFSVEDATDDAPTPPEGTIIIAALSTCHNTLRRVAIRNTWAKFPGWLCPLRSFSSVLLSQINQAMMTIFQQYFTTYFWHILLGHLQEIGRWSFSWATVHPRYMKTLRSTMRTTWFLRTLQMNITAFLQNRLRYLHTPRKSKQSGAW